MAISMHHPFVFIFGVLGNMASFLVYLAPIPTFTRICKKKSTEGFQSVPYLVALFSAMLWIYYAMHQTSDFLLIIINSLGCVIEIIYIGIYIAYAPKQPRTSTLKLFFLVNFGGFALIILVCHLIANKANQIRVLGWLCVALSVGAFAAPLSIMRLVIRTKSVEFMPFYLSLFLTLSAVMWLFYGVLLRDPYVAFPNVLGVIFGVIQIVLYGMYRNSKAVVEKQKVPEHIIEVPEISTIKTNSDEVLPSNNDEETTNPARDQNHVDRQTECNAKDQEYEHGQAQYCNERSTIAAIDHSQVIPCAA